MKRERENNEENFKERQREKGRKEIEIIGQVEI